MAEVFRRASNNRCSKRNKRRKPPTRTCQFPKFFYGSYEEDSEIADEERENDNATTKAETAEDLQEDIATLKEETESLQKSLQKPTVKRKRNSIKS